MKRKWGILDGTGMLCKLWMRKEISSDSGVIMTHTELGMNEESKGEFPCVTNRLWFLPTQGIWWKISESELVTWWSNDKNFNVKVRHLSALTFFPADENPGALNEFKPHLQEASRVTGQFENNSVQGRVRRHLCNAASITSIVSIKSEVCMWVNGQWISLWPGNSTEGWP